jgi:diketogulonate reductase-like aldo/keto reductase
MNTFTLHNGQSIPVIGLGTWQSQKNEAYEAVKHALKVGYRHIDTAMIYGNEEEVGKAIKEVGINREELFITTKLWNTDQGYEKTKKAIDLSLEKMGIKYIDLYLVHWFKGYDQLKQSWKAMEEAVKEGKIRSLGVSNHNIHHIMNLLEFAEIKPVINQVETHVELQNERLQQFCEANNILLEAYAPMMSWRIKDLLANETLQEIAKKYNKTVPQISLRWLIQRGIIILPKSINPTRIEQNFDVFDFSLTDEDMLQIRKLNKGNKMFPEFDNVDF